MTGVLSGQSHGLLCHTPHRMRAQRAHTRGLVLCRGDKEELKRLCARTQRGKKASVDTQKEVLRRVQALERQNPTKKPVTSPLINGKWSLLYTGPGREDDPSWQKRTGGVEGPFIAALSKLNLGQAVRTKGITQVIDTATRRVDNIADFGVGSLTSGRLSVAGTLEGDAAEPNTKVNVQFTSFSLQLCSLPALRLPLRAFNPKGWVLTTYLDKDLRIGRGDKGSVFVTAKGQG